LSPPPPPPTPPLFPYTTLFRSPQPMPNGVTRYDPGGQLEEFGTLNAHDFSIGAAHSGILITSVFTSEVENAVRSGARVILLESGDRKSTRLNSSHRTISYAVFC